MREFFYLSKRLACSCLCKFLQLGPTLGGPMRETRRMRRRMTPIGAADRCVELAAPLQWWGEMRKWKRDQWRDGWKVKGGGNGMETWSYLPSNSSPLSHLISKVAADITKVHFRQTCLQRFSCDATCVSSPEYLHLRTCETSTCVPAAELSRNVKSLFTTWFAEMLWLWTRSHQPFWI